VSVTDALLEELEEQGRTREAAVSGGEAVVSGMKENQEMKKATPKKPAAPKKRPRGRPRKNGHGRVQTQTWLPAELARQLDAYVAELQKAAPGASRGDVVAAALRTHRPFRRWLLKISSRGLE
jgi:hypothetical protein